VPAVACSLEGAELKQSASAWIGQCELPECSAVGEVEDVEGRGFRCCGVGVELGGEQDLGDVGGDVKWSHVQGSGGSALVGAEADCAGCVVGPAEEDHIGVGAADDHCYQRGG